MEMTHEDVQRITNSVRTLRGVELTPEETFNLVVKTVDTARQAGIITEDDEGDWMLGEQFGLPDVLRGIITSIDHLTGAGVKLFDGKLTFADVIFHSKGSRHRKKRRR